jgi:hypothetical protein
VSRGLSALVLLLSGAVWNLANGGEIRGSAVDSSGHPVVLSSVTITHIGNDPSSTLPGRTESAGAYRLLAVPAGDYDLTIRSSWFYEATIRAVHLGTEKSESSPPFNLISGDWQRVMHLRAGPCTIVCQMPPQLEFSVG